MNVIYYYSFGVDWLETRKDCRVYKEKVFYKADSIPFLPTKDTCFWFSGNSWESDVSPESVWWNSDEKYVEVSFPVDKIQELNHKEQEEIFKDFYANGWVEIDSDEKYDVYKKIRESQK